MRTRHPDVLGAFSLGLWLFPWAIFPWMLFPWDFSLDLGWFSWFASAVASAGSNVEGVALERAALALQALLPR